jgi:tetratricopeptide (TPR) repeat protein/CHAT domain-containing protein
MKRWVLWVILIAGHVVYPSANTISAESTESPVSSEWELNLDQSRTFQMNGDLPQAIQTAEKALSLAEQQLDPNDPKIVSCLQHLAGTHKEAGHYSEAEISLKRALAVCEKAFEPESGDVADTFGLLGDIYVEQGLYAAAEPLYIRALNISEKALGPDHPDVGIKLNNLASLCEKQGRYVEAESLYKQALDISVKALGSQAPSVGTKLNNLAGLYKEQNRYDEAEALYNQALEVLEKTLGPDHPHVGLILNNLADMYVRQGRYAEAEPLFDRSLVILEKTLGSEHSDVGALLGNLADLYGKQGRYAEAEPLLQRALVILEKALGPKHPFVGIGLSNLATLYHSQGRYAEAEPLYKRALGILEKTLGAQHPDVGRLIGNIASLYDNEFRYVESELLHKQALDIFEGTLGPEHPSVIVGLDNLAVLKKKQGHFAESEQLHKRALAVAEKNLDPDHPDTVTILNNLMSLYFDFNDKRALEFAQRAFNAESSVRAESFSMLSERQRMDFIGHRGNLPLRIAASLALQQPNCDSDAVRAAWQMVLRSKAAVLDAMLEDRQNLAGNPEAEALFTRLGEVKSRLSALQMSDVTKLDDSGLAGYRKQLDVLQHDRDDLEQSLARISGRFREGRRASKVTAEEIGKALPENTALVEFLRLVPVVNSAPVAEPRKPDDTPPQYVAFVLTDGNLPPKFIPVGDAGKIDLLIDGCRKKMERGISVTSDLQELYGLVWAPLGAYAGNKRRILISPDGALNQLPFAALRTPDERYLIEQYEIGYLACGRDLVRKVDGSLPMSPALFGDPVFKNSPAVATNSREAKSRLFRSVPGEGDRAMYRHLRLPALPATRDEVEQISKILSVRTPSVFLGSDASEANLKKTPRPEMLHLATHGFYFAETEESKSRPNPMLRSGLALSGASASLTGDAVSSGEDGIVTAEEVGSLDLWGTRLVVLSACDTGRGEALSGEGVFGLRRAFVQAGALNLMLTLWQVEDTFTKKLMIEFYRDYIQTGDAIGALSRVQRALVKEAPHFWAPFLISVQGGEQSR